jgi:hypothetical protein
MLTFDPAHKTSFNKVWRLEPNLDELLADCGGQQDTRLGDDARD